MKTPLPLIAVLALCLVASVPATAETVFQTVPGEAAVTSDGKKALAQKLIESKTLPEGEVSRTPGTLPQWGYVNYWFGISAPAGKTVVRFKIFVDDEATANFGAYTRVKGEQTLLGKIVIPADAPKNAFVTVDIPVDSPEEWNGISLKKIEKSDKPGPWIGSVSVVQP